ncbi:EF-hand domain-containing family member B-like [Lineus longissimus]|uniref:EF-hand domain-containing family member B-like n=1 Tax=Lineus longissimus TaxID=88925 RepID=UPI002B4FB4B1
MVKMTSSAVNRLPDIETKSIYAGQFQDRSPDKRAAGKLIATGDSASLCLKPPSDGRPSTPEPVSRFRASGRPDAGQMRVFYGKAYDPHQRWAIEMRHGVNTQPSMTSGELANPPPKTLFQQKMLDKKQSQYFSLKKGPLGKSHDQRPGLPKGLDPNRVMFGIKTLKDGSAGEMINPDKDFDDVCNEYDAGHDLYVVTHQDYRVGEAVDRNYKNPNYDSTSCFGIPTPHSNDGRHVRNTMKWLHTTNSGSEKHTPIVSKRADDFRERTQPQLGKVHDPIKDTLKVGPDHTFGILVKPDAYGAGDLLHMRSPGMYLRGRDRQRGILAAIRQHLKKSNYHNFQDLVTAFRHFDKDNSGTIDMKELRAACQHFNLPVEPELLEQLMYSCDSNNDGRIDYGEFANFLNWKDKMPSGFKTKEKVLDSKILSNSTSADMVPTSSRDSTPRRLQKQIDKAIGNHRTSSSNINAVVGGLNTKGYRAYGVPTNRTDLPAPRIKRIDDRKNYGDESDAHGLTNPSIFTRHGVFERDFLRGRSKDEIKSIFTNIGVCMTGQTFEEIWAVAASRHPKGEVSVESFRNVLDMCQANQIITDLDALEKSGGQMIAV